MSKRKRTRTLGRATILQDEDGNVYIDQDTLRRTDFSGDDDDFDDVESGYEFGYEDDYDDDDDDFGDDDFGDDDDDDDDEEFGATRGQKRRRSRRAGRKRRKAGRKRKRADRLEDRADELEGSSGPRKKKKKMQTAVISESTTVADAGAVVVKFQLNHHMITEDVSFEGSDSGAKVSMIMIGDRVAWNSPSGVPVSLFSASSRLRGLLHGFKAAAGQFVTVNGTTANANNTLQVTLIGMKPSPGNC